MIITRPLMPADLPEVIDMDLRTCDRAELTAMDPKSTIPEIIFKATRTANPQVLVVRDSIVGLFGVHPSCDLPEFGVAWAFGTNEGYDHMDEITEFAARQINEWLGTYKRGVGNYVSLENTKAVRWLKGLGFEFMGDVKHVSGMPFQFFMREHCV